MAFSGEQAVPLIEALQGVNSGAFDGIAPTGEYVVIQVSDSGTGMSAETRAHIFEPFFTTKEKGKGTGLGLATCYGIAKQSGGFISVESELGAGTTFRVYLPQQKEAASAVSMPAVAGDLPRGDESILVVEDDESLREVTVQTLREFGYNVCEALDGEAAQQILSASGVAPFDLVITDVGMPRVDGITLRRWLETHRPETRVLLVSGYAGDKGLREDDLAQEHRFLAKPFTRSHLATAVRKALEHKSATTPVPA